MKRDILVNFFNETLKLEAFSEDVSNNGLQVEGDCEVGKAVFAVDACQAVFDFAADAGAKLVFVHHGLSWGGEPRRWTGVTANRFRTLFANGISLYAAHLPLDANSDCGNNAVLAKMAGVGELVPFFRYDGVDIGFAGGFEREITLNALAAELGAALQTVPLIRGDGKRVLRRAAIVSGGGGLEALEEAAKIRADVLITGELNHIMHHYAAEAGVAVLALGHYASETTGPRAMMKRTAERFQLPTVFADFPTEL